MWSDFKKVTTQGMHNNSTSYAAGHWQISFNIKMLVGVSGVRCNVRPWLTYNIRILFYIKDFFYNVSVCFLFYSRVTDNRKTHDSGVQIVERGGSGERVKLYIGSGRVGGGEGKSGSLPLSPSKLPAFFFSSWIFLPRSTIRTPETGYQKSPWRAARPRLKLETAQITTGIATWFLNFSKGSVWLSLVIGLITALWQNGSQQT